MLPSGAFNASIAACRSDALRRTTRTTPLFEETAPYGTRLSRSVVRISRSIRSTVCAIAPCDVDLVDEVDAAAQIEAEAHRLQADAPHPARRARHARQSDQVVARSPFDDGVARRGLLLRVGEAHHQPVLLEVRGFRRDFLRFAGRRARAAARPRPSLRGRCATAAAPAPSPNTFGSAKSVPDTTTMMTSQYFQREN